MAENIKSTEFLTKLAMIADAGQTLINGKMTIIFEVMNPDYAAIAEARIKAAEIE